MRTEERYNIFQMEKFGHHRAVTVARTGSPAAVAKGTPIRCGYATETF